MGEHLAAPGEGFRLEAGERDDGVDEAHGERLLGVVLAAQEPDLAGLLLADDAGEVGRAEAAVERADLRSGLAEAGVVGGDRQVADDVEDVAAADRVAGDHGDDRLGQAADFFLDVEDVEAGHAVLAEVAARAADALVAAGAERLVALAGEDHDADLGVVVGEVEGGEQLVDGERAERVADLGAVDRDLGDPALVGGLVADVLELAGGRPHGGGSVA